MRMDDSRVLIEDPTPEEGFEGMILGDPSLEIKERPLTFSFDFHAAARYVRDNNLPRMTEEIMQMFVD